MNESKSNGQVQTLPKSYQMSDILNAQSQIQLQSKFSSFREDLFKSSSSRPQSAARKRISSQSNLHTIENNKMLPLNQISNQLQSQTQLHANSQTLPIRNSSGICGLINIGNSCFFNSSLQCIIHSHLFIDYILSRKYKSDLSPQNPLGTKCQLVKAFASLIDRIYLQKVTVESPKEVLSILSSYSPQFAGFEQQDAHELLIFLLDLLHEDMNRSKQHKSKTNEQVLTAEKSDDGVVHNDEVDDQIAAEKAWSSYKSKNDSIIVDLFHGLLRSQLVCPNCGKKDVIFEPFVTLSLPIPDQVTKFPEFLFIPYDPLQPKVRMSVPLNFGYNTLFLKQSLNREIGRVFDIAVCVHSKPTGSLEWTNVLPSSSSELADLFVFEVPDSKKSFYAVCSITVNRKKSLFSSLKSLFRENSQLVEEFILIPITKKYVGTEKLEKICEERLKFLWNKENGESVSMSKELIEFISTIEPFPASVQKKFTAEVVTSLFDRSLIFEKTLTFPFILNKTIKVTLNPAFMKDHFGFNWANLIRPIKFMKPKNEEVVEPTLENCIKQFCLETVLDDNNMWYCPRCKEFVNANKTTSIWSLPRYLVFHFKRFTQFFNTYRKNDIKIDYPQIIDLQPFIKGKTDPSISKYSLYAVCEHFGSMYGGHYVAHAFVEEKKHWYLFNDSSCRPSNEHAAHNEAAYLLFYERIGE